MKKAIALQSVIYLQIVPDKLELDDCFDGGKKHFNYQSSYNLRYTSAPRPYLTDNMVEK